MAQLDPTALANEFLADFERTWNTDHKSLVAKFYRANSKVSRGGRPYDSLEDIEYAMNSVSGSTLEFMRNPGQSDFKFDGELNVQPPGFPAPIPLVIKAQGLTKLAPPDDRMVFSFSETFGLDQDPNTKKLYIVLEEFQMLGEAPS